MFFRSKNSWLAIKEELKKALEDTEIVLTADSLQHLNHVIDKAIYYIEHKNKNYDKRFQFINDYKDEAKILQEELDEILVSVEEPASSNLK